jgi:hypothetical protein
MANISSAASQLTKKSIEAICNALELQGSLVRFEPVMLPGESEVRRLYVAPSVQHFLSGNFNKKVDRDYYANVRSFLGRFVKGGPMQHEEDLKKVMPFGDEVWSMRIRFNPHSRLFGAFLMEDCFVACRARFRDDLGKEYGGQKKGFDKARDDVVADWGKLFPGVPRFSGYPLSVCISGAVQ